MGYSHFDGNEEEVMEVFLKNPIWDKRKEIDKETIEAYPGQIKSLLRKKMIKKIKFGYEITERGKSAITQQLRNGEYWVGSLKPYDTNRLFNKPAKISRELAGYVK